MKLPYALLNDLPLRLWTLACVVALLTGGCRAPSSSFPQVNLDDPGWRVWQGQGVWRAKAGAPVISGEILAAGHSDGRVWVQFIKTPLPVVTAHAVPGWWRVRFEMGGKTVGARGNPPARLVWFQLARVLTGGEVQKPWLQEPNHGDRLILTNPASGERFEGYMTALNPGARLPPKTSFVTAFAHARMVSSPSPVARLAPAP